MKTTERLAAALREAGAPAEMIKSALAGRYDDFLSESAFPIHDLMNDANRNGLGGIALRAMKGEFDATKEEADAWAKGPEAQALFKTMKKQKGGAD